MSFISNGFLTPAERAALLGLDETVPSEAATRARRRVRPARRPRVAVMLNLDADLIEWFQREEGQGCAARINSVLRAHMEAKEGDC